MRHPKRSFTSLVCRHLKIAVLALEVNPKAVITDVCFINVTALWAHSICSIIQRFVYVRRVRNRVAEVKKSYRHQHDDGDGQPDDVRYHDGDNYQRKSIVYKLFRKLTIVAMWIEIGNSEVVVDEGAEVLLPNYMTYADPNVNLSGTALAMEAIVAFGRDPVDGGFLLIRGDGLIMTASAKTFGEEWPVGDRTVILCDGGLTIKFSVDNIDFEADASYVIDRAMSTGISLSLVTLDRYLGRHEEKE